MKWSVWVWSARWGTPRGSISPWANGVDGATADILEQLGDIFVVMCEALIAEEVPIHVVKRRIEEYVQEELFKDSTQNYPGQVTVSKYHSPLSTNGQ